MLLQYTVNVALLWGKYSLLACGFSLSSTCCRHYNFAVGGAFIAAPYAGLATLSWSGSWEIALVMAVSSAALFGILYQMFAMWLWRRGLREGQLLIVSLAIMGIAENGILILAGSESRSLLRALRAAEIVVLSPASMRWLVLGSYLALVTLGILVWAKSTFGRTIKALAESPDALALRGYSVPRIQSLGAAIGFACTGAAGILHGIEMQLRPSLAIESAILGVICAIVGSIILHGLLGLLFAALALAIAHVVLIIATPGDWSMTSPLAVLLFALLCKQYTRRVELS